MRFASTAIAVLLSASVPSVSGQFQSGPSVGNSYAGGLVYDAAQNVFYATGATYQPLDDGDTTARTTTPLVNSACFLTVLNDVLEPTNTKLYDEPDVTGACSALSLDASVPGTSVFVAGFEERDGRAVGGVFETDILMGTGEIIGGYSLNGQRPVTYPVAVAADGSFIYVLRMTSTDDTINSEAASAGDMPNWTSGGIPKFGSEYFMTVERLGKPPLKVATLTQEFVATGNKPDVYAGGLLVHETGVYVVGSTRGSGAAFGEGNGSDDGFITRLSIDSLSIDATARIGDPNVDDMISGICADPSDPSAIFVVGGTIVRGGALAPTISRISTTETLETQWTEVLGVLPANDSSEAEPSAYALSCEVDGDVLYVAGHVGDGTLMSGATQSFGGYDVFLAQLMTGSGDVLSVQQVGSTGDEELSRGNGLTLDASGDAVLFGHTNGPLFRKKTDSVTDLFAVTIPKVDAQGPPPTFPLPTGEEASENAVTTRDEDTEDVRVDTNSAIAQGTTPNSIFDESQLGTQIKGPIYAGGLAYSSDANKVYFTGALYNDGTTTFTSSDCFLGELDLFTSTAALLPIGATDIPEACSALSLAGGSNPKAFLAGNTEFGGLNSVLADPDTASSIKQFGSVIEVLLGQSSEEDSVGGGYLLGGKTVTYPVAIVAEKGNDNVYVASLASDDGSETGDNAVVEQEQYPDLTSGGLRRFGFRYYLRFTKVNLESQTAAEENFMTDDSSSVYASGIAIVGNNVIIVGSTRGSGGVFGNKEGADMDGFVLRLGDSLGDTFGWSMVNNARIDSANSQDDWITQICSDPNDPTSFYMVGATMGLVPGFDGASSMGSVSPIVVKMSVDSMDVEWWAQLSAVLPGSDAATEATAFGCTVDNGNVYVAGIVKDGASIVSPDNGAQTSMGMDDLFVAKMAASSGEVSWARQFGTSKNEGIGKGGSIATDASGNVILLGQTQGILYSSNATESDSRRRLLAAGVSDLIVLSVSPAGAFRTPMDEPEESGEGIVPGDEPDPDEPAPTAPDPAPITAPVPEPTSAPVEEPAPEPAPVQAPVEAPTKPAPSPKKEKDEPNKILPVVLISIGALLLLCSLCVCCIRARKRAQDRNNQRKMLSIFKYLHAFDVDDIDIRRSPAGGYHGTYLNDLAHGENLSPVDEETYTATRPNISHGSVADDYMFMSKRTISTNDDDNDSQTGLSSHL
eukprot:CAMPEP_0117006464 /NCGR_PEP_ID=MMETSP0472-20121206/6683_1 /TAXON_ID=693140 ORGANISM="Tiarina fusus, Strain LIS" /NCGR_SAMPLE_ID=MMETSP0472 /ASSEMBLY_ACC=CAM_ASM_000603 /LENGTH=1198 /DNA_ID=CAMNT_0004707937 /DNA_START=301 /DNA_END=3897 /DNA_ORIENTATION=+